jgi:hypothetical protein
MSAYGNQVKAYIERYQAEMGGNALLDPHAVAEWAYAHGLHKPSVRTVVDVIAQDIAQFFREEYRTNADGQRYRAKHAVRSKDGDRTMSLWADIDDDKAPREHFVRSFAQRRQQIVGDCFQLKTDVDVYNGKNPDKVPIQVPLNFTLDVEELQLPLKGQKAA